ncbi:hypothetical protein [Methylobacterium pseudosasicola]|uniref:Uncharacterized protein n=1 Tax=Methylobacterium pseudosasicola TaxID=582667 RepID=A0A1I4UAH8_9HYPH|nr:hypothetical protein [Methylobacterium pseudosasicola]SFM86009.1 hypothetical protein SAMN05192568_106613 [Methylobacterium pseudosasicola]
MTATMNEMFWTQLDARIATNRPSPETPATAEIVRLADAADPAAANPAPSPAEPAAVTPHAVADWTRVLDTISVAKDAAQQQEVRLREQAAVREALAADLQRAQQEILTLETLLRDTQAQAEEAIRDVQARAEARIRDAEDYARAADLRAEAAEDWLRRIEQASRDLLPGDRRAAA